MCLASPSCAEKLANSAEQPELIEAPWTCSYAYYGCSDPKADNYASDAIIPLRHICQYGGCNDTNAINFDVNATYNNGNCTRADCPRAHVCQLRGGKHPRTDPNCPKRLPAEPLYRLWTPAKYIIYF